jgi:hypothetical protein
MAGSRDKSPAGDGATAKQPGPRVKNFECPNCGASVTIRTPGLAMSAICQSCHSVIDVSDENYRILLQYFSAQKNYLPLIELGTRGKLRGKLWEVIGYMVRADQASDFAWEEYLLFNPYYGYRWLTQSEGHWNLVRTIKEKPIVRGTRRSESATLNNQKYTIFNRGKAVVKFVIGEFYWRVRVENIVEMTDYISPPYMLSIERDRTEIVWAQSEYVEPKEILDAFKVTKDVLSARRKIGPNQVSVATRKWTEIWKLWVLFMTFLTVAEIAQVAMASNKELLRQSFEYTPNTKVPEVTTPVFALEKDASNLRLVFNTPMDNSWWYASGELVNNENGQSYPFERTCEYYHGYDGGESWSEGSARSELLISSLPKGHYYLNLDVETGSIPGTANQQYSLVVTNDVPTYANYFWSLFFLSVIPIWQYFRSQKDEVARWSQSDFSPYSSS